MQILCTVKKRFCLNKIGKFMICFELRANSEPCKDSNNFRKKIMKYLINFHSNINIISNDKYII